MNTGALTWLFFSTRQHFISFPASLRFKFIICALFSPTFYPRFPLPKMSLIWKAHVLLTDTNWRCFTQLRANKSLSGLRISSTSCLIFTQLWNGQLSYLMRTYKCPAVIFLRACTMHNCVTFYTPVQWPAVIFLHACTISYCVILERPAVTFLPISVRIPREALLFTSLSFKYTSIQSYPRMDVTRTRYSSFVFTPLSLLSYKCLLQHRWTRVTDTLKPLHNVILSNNWFVAMLSTRTVLRSYPVRKEPYSGCTYGAKRTHLITWHSLWSDSANPIDSLQQNTPLYWLRHAWNTTQ